MNFRYINPHNVAWLVPAWAADPFQLARTLDGMLAHRFGKTGRPRWDKPLDFWVECTAVDDGYRVAMLDPDGAPDALTIGRLHILGDGFSINVPLNDMLKGSPPAAGTYCVYYHYFETELPAAYFGVTKRRWFDRYAQHVTAARAGSPYLFHRSIREHSTLTARHFLLVSGSSEDAAMALEEEMVGLGTLYPLGLNMIPGGRAGIRYLHNFGVRVSNAEARDLAVQELLSQPSAAGRPNPLCAARWESDPDYAARVICGHSGRLTAEQVRIIRLMAVAGHKPHHIAATIGDNTQRVGRVLVGKRYGRVA